MLRNLLIEMAKLCLSKLANNLSYANEDGSELPGKLFLEVVRSSEDDKSLESSSEIFG